MIKVTKKYEDGVRAIHLKHKDGYAVMYRIKNGPSFLEKADRISGDIVNLAEAIKDLTNSGDVVYLLDTIKVKKDVRRSGIGSQLLNAAKKLVDDDKGIVYLYASDTSDDLKTKDLDSFYSNNDFMAVDEYSSDTNVYFYSGLNS